MDTSQRLLDFYLPPAEGFVLESMVATTYQVDFEFLEEELLASALGVRSPISRMRAFRTELERRLQTTDVSVLYDLRGCDRLARLSPRIDPIPVVVRKLHAKITLLMWVRSERDVARAAERRVRLMVGSANLTRQGFRENYECVVATDFGGRSNAPRFLLESAIELIHRIAAEKESPQLTKQLKDFSAYAAGVPDRKPAPDDPLALVAANEVVPVIRDAWSALSDTPPSIIRIVSPFWPEGVTAADALFDLVTELGIPERLELVCRGILAGDGKTWVPEFDADVAMALREKLAVRLFLQPALPDVDVKAAAAAETELGDETEEHEFAQHRNGTPAQASGVQRALHAKMLLVEGARGSVLYVGSSNCTRKGLGLGGAINWEAGFIYRLTPRQRKQVDGLFRFAGPATEVRPNQRPQTVTPIPKDEPAVPTFLEEVLGFGGQVTVGFRDAATIPADLVILMPIPTKGRDEGYWIIFQAESSAETRERVTVDLIGCRRCDASMRTLPNDADESPNLPHVFVEVRWEGHTVNFPVRFDDKTTLPLLLVGRKATEGELIEYFLYGREPDDMNDGAGIAGQNGVEYRADEPIDTRRILAYFIRRFVQAIPGIEAEISRAGYSRTALDAALRGPTSPLELAERAFASLLQRARSDEPEKTPTAVAFQLTEILAALLRSRGRLAEPSLASCVDPVVARCRELLNKLVADHAELQDTAFRMYRERFVGGA